MQKGKAISKQVRPKASQRLQARRSGGQPKKGTHCQKRPASDGSDDVECSEAECEGPRSRPQKKLRHLDVNEEEVKKEENEENVEQVVGDGDKAQSEDIEQVSLL
jgi:hypothetical protein